MMGTDMLEEQHISQRHKLGNVLVLIGGFCLLGILLGLRYLPTKRVGLGMLVMISLIAIGFVACWIGRRLNGDSVP